MICTVTISNMTWCIPILWCYSRVLSKDSGEEIHHGVFDGAPQLAGTYAKQSVQIKAETLCDTINLNKTHLRQRARENIVRYPKHLSSCHFVVTFMSTSIARSAHSRTVPFYFTKSITWPAAELHDFCHVTMRVGERCIFAHVAFCYNAWLLATFNLSASSIDETPWWDSN